MLVDLGPSHEGIALLASAPRNGRRSNVGGPERIASAIGGGLLAFYGLRRRGAVGYGLVVAGAELMRRGVTGRCPFYGTLGVSTAGGQVHADHAAVDPEEAVAVERAVTIARTRQELYAVWRDLEPLPCFVEHLERVEIRSPTRSHWVAKGPGGIRLAWDAVVVEDREGERIAWETVEPTTIPHRGQVSFRDAPGGRGTEMRVSLEYEHPAGVLGRRMSQALPAGRLVLPVRTLFGRTPDQQLRGALRRFKQLMETGEIPTTEGQSSGRMSEGSRT